MTLHRVLPPTAAPFGWRDVCEAAAAMLRPADGGSARAEELGRYLGVSHAFLVSSGTAALALTLLALRSTSSRRDVIIPAYTCFSVPAAVLACGLRPIPCDIDRATYGLDPRLVARAITPRTLCAVTQHLYGIPSDTRGVVDICRPRGVFVIEDAAQALGVVSGGRAVGTSADAGVFSLGRGKHLNAGGGGIIATDSPPIAALLQRRMPFVDRPTSFDCVRDCLKAAAMLALTRPRLFWIPASIPALRLGETIYPASIPMKRLSAVAAGLMGGWRRRLDRHNARRAGVARAYLRALRMPGMPDVPYLRLPLVMPTAADRDRVLAASRERGLGIAPGYPASIDMLPQVAPFSGAGRFPVAHDLAARLITLPTHPYVLRRDVDAVLGCL